MCGIAGIISRKPYLDVNHLDIMRDAMTHRGPDGYGSWWSDDGTIGLAHRRLAILDLSPSGAQPMISEDGTYVIVFNGEIYNHEDLRRELSEGGFKFRGKSDTEVILFALQRWGIDAIKHLSGMFVFAVYNHQKKTLLIVRDRAGEKPLFWSQTDGVFSFASELKGLLARPGQPRNLSEEGFDLYLAYGSVSGSSCILNDVHKLPPAHFLELDCTTGEASVRRYWDLPQPLLDTAASEEDLVDRLHDLLSVSIRRQLVADVPVGVLLSGGVDSSLVTAIAAAVSSKPVRTFTVGFPGHERYDERPYARNIADNFGTEHIELDAREGSLDLVVQLAQQYDEPMCDSSMIPTYLVSALVREHCTVALGGDGGDELFGGYRSYQGALKLARLRNNIPRPLREAMSSVSRNLLPLGFPHRNGLNGLGRSNYDASDWGKFFDPKTRLKLSPWLRRWVGAGDAERSRPRLENQRGVPGAYMAFDFRGYLADDILVKVDRASMLSSLEVRAPFLDPAIIEFAFRDVPNHLRATAEERKILLRRLARRLLPKNHDLERKQGFSIPLVSWLSDSSVLNRLVDRIAASPVLDGEYVRKLFTADTISRRTELFFSLLLFEEWRDAYTIANL